MVIREIAIPLFQEAIQAFEQLGKESKYAQALVIYYSEFKITKNPGYNLHFRNSNSRIKLLKLIGNHLKPIKVLLPKIPTSLKLVGNDFDFLINIPSQYGRKTFNLHVLENEINLDLESLRLKSTFDNVFRIYQSCLVHFNAELTNTSDRIHEYLIKDKVHNSGTS